MQCATAPATLFRIDGPGRSIEFTAERETDGEAIKHDFKATPSARAVRQKQRMERAVSAVSINRECNLGMLDDHTIFFTDVSPVTR